MAIRHQDEILLPAVSTDSTAVPRYNLEGADGSVIAENVALRLANTISQEGTPIDKTLLDEFLAASGVTAGSGTAYTLAQAGYRLFDGAVIRIRLHTPNGENATLNINGTGAKPLRDMAGKGLSRGIPAGTWLMAIYSASAGAYIVSGSLGLYRVGDIKETMRTDLGDEWLFCNGDLVEREKYPELYDILPYNTEWRDLPQGRDYFYIKPIDTERYWMFHTIRYNHYRYKNDTYATKKILVFDSYTWEFTEVACPSTGAAYESISGLVYDGSRFVMCVTADTNTRFYTSTNLKNWTLAYTYTGATNYGAYDMAYDGVAYVVAFYGYVNNYDRSFIIAVNKTLTGYTTLFAASTWADSFLVYPCPGNRWMRCYNPYTTSSSKAGVFAIYAGGTATEVIQPGERWVEFFDDDTLINASGSVVVSKLTAKTKTTINTNDLLGVTSSGCRGILYDANTDIWTLYLVAAAASDTEAYYAAHISGTSDPTKIENYMVEPIPELPQLPEEQSNFAHAHAQMGDFYPIFRDPTSKHLPIGDSGVYSYINAGESSS